jgi:outer membrane protein assembly factor BamA
VRARATPPTPPCTASTPARVFEGEDLPIELTLGEDNGLRGYPAREFSGTRRLRFNLEDRIDTGLEVRTVRFGLVPFFDAAWIGDEGWGSPLASVGVGLRIGSPEIFGRGVLRFDLAFPLTEVGGESFDPSLSIALGQVFTFFGNSSLLSSR